MFVKLCMNSCVGDMLQPVRVTIDLSLPGLAGKHTCPDAWTGSLTRGCRGWAWRGSCRGGFWPSVGGSRRSVRRRPSRCCLGRPHRERAAGRFHSPQTLNKQMAQVQDGSDHFTLHYIHSRINSPFTLFGKGHVFHPPMTRR